MKTILKVSLFAMAALGLTSCAPPANTNTNTNANTNAAPKAAAPTADSLAALDKQAWEAFGKKDAAFFEGFLADNFVGFGDDGKRPTRAEAIKMIGENKCEIKSFSFSDTKVTMVGADAAVLTYKATQDGTCEGQKLPSPATVATVFVRSGDSWKAAYHNEVAMMVPTAGTSGNSNAAAAVDDKKDAAPAAERKAPPPPPAVNSNSTANSSSNSNSNSNAAAPAGSDALTEAILAVEKKGWEGWMRQDAKALEAVTSKDLSFVDITGKVTHGQAEVIKGWTDGSCKVTSVDVSDAKASMITKDAAILTFKGTAVGTCGDMKLEPLWGTTVAVKEGDTWKAVYIFETPMRKS